MVDLPGTGGGGEAQKCVQLQGAGGSGCSGVPGSTWSLALPFACCGPLGELLPLGPLFILIYRMGLLGMGVHGRNGICQVLFILS